MKKHILAQTNLFVCSIIIVGFLLTSYISYSSNLQLLEKDLTHVTKLASEGIFYRINLIFSEPVNVALAMANDNLLKEFLSAENSREDEASFIERMREYLSAYQNKYNYSSVFLVSTQTNKYYHINGLDRILTLQNPENIWYYKFINNSLEYALNVDNDEADNNKITVFVNAKIYDNDGIVLGVVGVGFSVNSLQAVLKKYEEEFDVETSFINKDGFIEISPQKTALENIKWIEDKQTEVPLKSIIENTTSANAFWASSPTEKSYIVTRYVPNLDWYLIIKNSTDALSGHFNKQAIHNATVIIIIILLVLLTITSVIHKYNNKIVSLSAQRQRDHYINRQQTIKRLYKNIYEFDITNNCAGDRRTERYFESLGFASNTPYDAALCLMAEKLVKQEFRDDYIKRLSPKNILQAYHSGIKNLIYDFMPLNTKILLWQRLVMCIYYSSDTQALRLAIYCYSIDEEKKYEHDIVAQMQCDPLTGLYTKAIAQEIISEKLAKAGKDDQYAFIILNIDNFKTINTTSGYEAGDFAITIFSQSLKEQFQEDAIVGRMGGDEFFIFLQVTPRTSLEQNVKCLVKALHKTVGTDNWRHTITVSVGAALAPAHGNTFAALYKNAGAALDQTKDRGKNGYTMFNKVPDFHQAVIPPQN